MHSRVEYEVIFVMQTLVFTLKQSAYIGPEDMLSVSMMYIFEGAYFKIRSSKNVLHDLEPLKVLFMPMLYSTLRAFILKSLKTSSCHSPTTKSLC